MSDQNNQEPTMEEILASIRRIISEDEAPADAAAPAAEEAVADPVAEAPPASAAPEPEPEPELEDDVLELTDRVEEPEPVAPEPAAPPPSAFETLGDLDVFPAPSAPAPEPVAYDPPAPQAYEEPLIGQPAASTAASAFSQLAATISMPKDGRSLEDVVRELLRPLLKAWLDENLPRIVQAKVEEEVERIARRR